MTVLIGMFLLGLFIAFGTWVVSWSNHVKRELVVHVYYCTSDTCAKDATTAQMNEVARIATAKPAREERRVRVEGRRPPDHEAEASRGGRCAPDQPLPERADSHPKRGEDVEKVAQLFQASPAVGIDKVDYGKQTTSRVLKLAHVIEIFFIIAVLLLLAASTLLIANTIRLSIFSRRREIEVMKLVGATNWFVRGPFMLEGLLCGIAGALGAVILLVIGKEIALPSLLHSGPLKAGDDVNAIAFSLNALILLGTGLLLGAAGSGFTIRRFLKV